jgi:PAS domain S-box-containing protein
MTENIESASVCTGSHIRVLHVDDEPQFSKVTRHILETEGDFKVDTAACAEEALTKIKDTDYDVIVSDYRLPGKNGLELLKELRTSGNVTPFLILTGKGDKDVIINALNMGVTQYLKKSSDSEHMYTTLMHTIQNVVKNRILHEITQLFDTLYKMSPVATALYNEKGEIHKVNTAYLDMMEISDIKDIKPNLFNYFKPPDGLVQKLREGKAVQYETFLEPKIPLYVIVLITPLGLPHQGYIVQVEDMIIKKEGETLKELCEKLEQIAGGHVEFQSVSRDITDRKRAEEQLKESEEKHRIIVELAPDGIVILDLKGVVTSCNTAFLKLTGYSKDEIVGKHMTSLPTIHFKDLPQYLKLFSSVLRGKIFTPFEFDWVHKDGSIHQGEIHATLMKKNGKRIGIQSIVRDITARKQTENALQQERDKLKALIGGLNRVGVGIDVVDVNYKILLTNDVLKKEFGDLTGKLCYKEYMGLDEPCDFCPMEKAITHNTVECAEFVDINGRYKQLFSAPLPNPDHTIDRVIEVAIDITERIKAEKALRESQLKFKRLFMSNPEAAVYLDSELRVLDINPQFEKLFGYSLPEIKGEVITIIVPEDKITEVQTLDKTTERQVYHDTVRKRKNGSLVAVSVSTAPITVEDQPLGHVVLYKDISQLKNVEKTLKKTLEKLETVNEKLRVVGSMTRHDIRNKLSTVTGAVYLARKQHTDKKALELFEDIEGICWDMERILDFARTYEQLGAEDLDYINVEEILTEAVTLFSLMDNVTIVNECEGLTVLADSMLRHVFYGLIDNSLRHGETVSTIKVYYAEENNYLKLIYEDDGTGIADKEKEEIFKEGYGTGTGYGLYIIKKICEAYNWDISETGTHTQGAQFTIVIPQSDISPYIISE